MIETVSFSNKFYGKVRVPGDKSISHRSLLFGALAEGTTEIAGLLPSQDVLSTLGCLKALGVRVSWNSDQPTTARVESQGISGWRAPLAPLDCGNSGTTMRLLMGVLATCPFTSKLIGDSSLSRRPMDRVAKALGLMGAKSDLTENKFAPLTLQGSSTLKGISYELPVASAQLKSALMLAALFSNGETVLTGKLRSRDHSERLLTHFGAEIEVSEKEIRIVGPQKLKATSMEVPGDPSSAAFLVAAAMIIPGAEIEIEDVGLNPTRMGFFHAVKSMGGDVEWEIKRPDPEPRGVIRARYSKLKTVKIAGEIVPDLIDELPLLAVLGAFSEGDVEIRDAKELRIKETDRIEAVAKNLLLMGAEVETFPDGLRVKGKKGLKAARFESFGDHRIAMAFSVAALGLQGDSEIVEAECVDVSFPGFFQLIKRLAK